MIFDNYMLCCVDFFFPITAVSSLVPLILCPLP